MVVARQHKHRQVEPAQKGKGLALDERQSLGASVKPLP